MRRTAVDATAKSVTGWVTTLGGTALSWKSQKQSTVALSTAESEYMAACYLKSVLQELKFPHNVKVYSDSTAALSMIRNPVQMQKAKHFNVQYHSVRECQED